MSALSLVPTAAGVGERPVAVALPPHDVVRLLTSNEAFDAAALVWRNHLARRATGPHTSLTAALGPYTWDNRVAQLGCDTAVLDLLDAIEDAS